MVSDDMALVREFAVGKSERAFEVLVSRHVNLVYSVALRQVRDPDLAEEVTQAVFLVLARKAASLDGATILSGWLCRTARHVSANLLTTQRRRQQREQEAYMQSLGTESETQAWTQIAPLLDGALAQLGEKDHNAVVLRFFEGRSFQEVGAALGGSEDSAKKRVRRALEKLRIFFLKHGVTLSVAVIAGVVSTHCVQAAPPGLAASVTVAAVHGTTVSASTLSLTQTTLKIMAWTKLKTTVAVGAIALLGFGTAFVAVHHPDLFTPAPQFAFAGYATPEASVQSTIWAGSIGDFKKLQEGWTPEQLERIQSKLAGKTDEEIKREAINWANALKGYRITRKEVKSDSVVHLHINAPVSAEGLRTGSTVVVMKRMGNDWKQAGEAD